MDIDTARLFTEKHPGHIVLMDTETCILSASKAHMANMGLKNSDLGRISYFDVPIRVKYLAKYFQQTDKELIAGLHRITALTLWSLRDNKQMLVFGEKLSIKDKSDNVVAIIAHNINITHSNLIDISRFIKLSNNDKHAQRKDNQFFYKIHQSNTDNQGNLSEREMECLFYILRGKSAKEIGKLLRLSYRTVENHIENIKFKFNVIRKSELIEKAIEQGYMNILPQSLFAKII